MKIFKKLIIRGGIIIKSPKKNTNLFLQIDIRPNITLKIPEVFSSEAKLINRKKLKIVGSQKLIYRKISKKWQKVSF